MYGFSWKHKLDVCRNNESLWPGFLWPALPLKRMMDLLSLLSVYCTQSYETWPLMSWIVRTCPNIHHLRNILMCSLCLAFFFFFLLYFKPLCIYSVWEKLQTFPPRLLSCFHGDGSLKFSIWNLSLKKEKEKEGEEVVKSFLASDESGCFSLISYFLCPVVFFYGPPETHLH